jgi:carboxylesterase type B
MTLAHASTCCTTALSRALWMPAGTAAPPRVKTGNGTVEGTRESSGVRVFRGIPYASPPVGDRRWQPPQPLKSWTGVRHADGFGARCMQRSIFRDMVFRSNGMSEDCLYLNVWAPATSSNARLPVLVYFSVSAQMTSPLSKTLIAGAIGESGAMIAPTLPPVTLADGERNGVAFATGLDRTSLQALRAVPADQLLEAAAKPGVAAINSATIDGYFLNQAPTGAFAAGEQAHVPLLAGWNLPVNDGPAQVMRLDVEPQLEPDAREGRYAVLDRVYVKRPE